jgi:hypothetical protein
MNLLVSIPAKVATDSGAKKATDSGRKWPPIPGHVARVTGECDAGVELLGRERLACQLDGPFAQRLAA